MPAQLTVLYKKPTDAAAFDRYYAATHIPIAKKIPGLRRYDVSSGAVGAAAGESPYHLVATLHFDSMADIQAGLGSTEGQAAAGDLANFAQAGVELYMFETRQV